MKNKDNAEPVPVALTVNIAPENLITNSVCHVIAIGSSHDLSTSY